MRRRALFICLALTALVPLAAPAAAPAKRKKVKKPVVTRVSPMRVGVGGTLTIRGRNFSAKRSRNTVVFSGPGGRSVFTKPRRASRRKLVVRVPSGVARILRDAGRRRNARFKLRVLSNRKFGRWTRKRLSPVLVTNAVDPPAKRPGKRPGKGPGKAPTGGGGGGSSPAPCPSGDPDGDLLTTATEATLKTNPCRKDTDGDTVEDGYEFRSALDLNDDEFQEPNGSLPYPGKRPYPNPLDSSDRHKDFDGDSLTLSEEQRLWHYTITNGATRTLNPLTYSDGEQYSVFTRGSDGRRVPTLSRVGYAKQQSFLDWASANGYRQVMLSDGAPWYDGTQHTLYNLLDFDRNGSEAVGVLAGFFWSEVYYYDHRPDTWLSDDERDEDADGLTNYDETHGRLTPGYWAACYSMEQPFEVAYAGPSFVDPDSDGDTVRDGADDQDHDDIPNVMELSRNAASGLNDTDGKTCSVKDGLGVGNFRVTGGPLPDGALVVTFENELGNLDVAQMTASGAGLTGGSSPAVNVATTRPGGGGEDEQQTVTITGSPTGGGFTLTFDGNTTPQLAYNADAATVEAALEALVPADDNSNHPNAYGRVAPFNPCLPAAWSRTCSLHPAFSGSGAPFDDSPNWYSLN